MSKKREKISQSARAQENLIQHNSKGDKQHSTSKGGDNNAGIGKAAGAFSVDSQFVPKEGSAKAAPGIQSARLKERLRVLNLSHKQVASLSGLSVSSISKMVSGERGSRPSQYTISALARALGTTPGWLTGGEEITLLTVIRSLHNEAIHAIRSVFIDRQQLLVHNFKKSGEVYEFLATKCRDSFAAVIGLDPDRLHCSIKLRETIKDVRIANQKVWTLARSTSFTSDPVILQRNLRKEIKEQTVGTNSASAALVGCSDGKTNWLGKYNCFCCDDLEKYPKYVNIRPGWPKFYKSTVVFPLRWSKRGEGELEVSGFLSFDSNLKNIFSEIPCTFEYQHSPGEYYKKLYESATVHVGGIIADILALIIALLDESEPGRE